LQADLSVVATFFRDSQSGMVHLDAVKKEFQLEIRPFTISSKMVRAVLFPFQICFGAVLR
jgi:hypothetical protein